MILEVGKLGKVGSRGMAEGGAMSFVECMGYAQEEAMAALTLVLGWDLEVRRAMERRYR